MTHPAESDAHRPGCEMHECSTAAVGIGDIDGDEYWLCDKHRYPIPPASPVTYGPPGTASRWCAVHDAPAAECWSDACLIPPAEGAP